MSEHNQKIIKNNIFENIMQISENTSAEVWALVQALEGVAYDDKVAKELQDMIDNEAHAETTVNKNKHKIRVGDLVRVEFNNSRTTLCQRATIKYIPQASGDSWVFHDQSNDLIHYVSEGCTITKLND